MYLKGRTILDGVCYHILARGNQKQQIFIREKDYKEYIKRVKRYKRRHKFKLYGYCLMPNHVHLVGEIKKKENPSKFMQGITRSYTVYFNKAYSKVGHLWQARFKSKVIVRDEYLINCICYIELNPVRANLVHIPHEYKWSSYTERNLSVAKEKQILDTLRL